MQMPAARVKAFKPRSTHKGGEVAEPPANLPRSGAEQNKVVGCFERAPRRKSALHLPRTPFVFERSERKVQFFQSIGHCGKRAMHQVQICFGMKRVARFNGVGVDSATLGARCSDVFGG